MPAIWQPQHGPPVPCFTFLVLGPAADGDALDLAGHILVVVGTLEPMLQISFGQIDRQNWTRSQSYDFGIYNYDASAVVG
jgi:hypothetical protein